MSLKNRNGKVGLFAMIILMLSIVLFIGSLFWLYVNGPWSGQESNYFQPTSANSTQNLETYKEPSLEDAIIDLMENDCLIVNYEKDIDLNGIPSYSFYDFKELAIKSTIVLKIKNDENSTILYIQNNKKRVQWIP